MKDCFIAVDIGGTNIRFALVDSLQNILKKTFILTSEIKSKNQFLDILKKCVLDLNIGFNVKKIAIVIPAPFNCKTTKIEDITNIACIENLDFQDIRKTLSSYEVFFENDVNVIAYLESRIGIGKNYNDLVYITFSTGVGSGIVINNKIHNGINGYAGEIGSFIINPSKENFLDGTLENLCSGNALAKLATEIYGEEKTCEYIFEMYKEGEKKSIAIIEEWIQNVSIGIANVIQLLDPDLIVLGGSIITCNNWVTEKIYNSTREKLLGKLSTKLKIESTVFGSEAGLLGAAYYAQGGIL